MWILPEKFMRKQISIEEGSSPGIVRSDFSIYTVYTIKTWMSFDTAHPSDIKLQGVDEFTLREEFCGKNNSYCDGAGSVRFFSIYGMAPRVPERLP